MTTATAINTYAIFADDGYGISKWSAPKMIVEATSYNEARKMFKDKFRGSYLAECKFRATKIS